MKKQTKVLLAAALFTLGASFSSMAALKNGEWKNNEKGWQYVDKDGDYVSEAWCVSYGKEYWIDEDEVLGTSQWVEDDEVSGRWYYAQSDGSKTISDWKYLYHFQDDDEEGDKNWYWFDAKGRMAKNGKYVIGDYTYYFDEDGKMLTGWIECKKDAKGNIATVKSADTKTLVGNVLFADENGHLAKSTWLTEFPWTKDADDCYEGEDEEYFYAKSNGYLATTKTDINGLTYFFNRDTAIMIEGWVEKVVEGTTTYYTASNAIKAGKTVYWTNEIGYASKNRWEEIERPEEDDEVFWYHFNKLGEVRIADVDSERAQLATASEATFVNGEAYNVEPADEEDEVVVETVKIDGKEYYITEKGEMLDGLQFINGQLMYLVDGVKQTGKVTLTDEYENDYTFMFAPKTTDYNIKYVAASGNYDGYCYFNGQLVKAEEDYAWAPGVLLGWAENDEPIYALHIVDENGKIQKSTSKEYFNEGETFEFSSEKDETKYSVIFDEE